MSDSEKKYFKVTVTRERYGIISIQPLEVEMDKEEPKKKYSLREFVLLRNMWRAGGKRTWRQKHWEDYHTSKRKVFNKSPERIYTSAGNLFAKLEILERQENKLLRTQAKARVIVEKETLTEEDTARAKMLLKRLVSCEKKIKSFRKYIDLWM